MTLFAVATGACSGWSRIQSLRGTRLSESGADSWQESLLRQGRNTTERQLHDAKRESKFRRKLTPFNPGRCRGRNRDVPVLQPEWDRIIGIVQPVESDRSTVPGPAPCRVGGDPNQKPPTTRPTSELDQNALPITCDLHPIRSEASLSLRNPTPMQCCWR